MVSAESRGGGRGPNICGAEAACGNASPLYRPWAEQVDWNQWGFRYLSTTFEELMEISEEAVAEDR